MARRCTIAAGRWPDRSWGWRRLASDVEGAAVVEFALVISMLSIVLLNTVDVARYYYARSEVENATQMGAQSAWKTCDTTKLPASTNCPTFQTAVSAGVQSTSLGTAVALQAGSPSEGYYCVSASGVLTWVSNVAAKPADCSGVGSPSGQPADYVQIQTTYAYHPIFTGLSIGSLMPPNITSTSMMRMQ